MTQTRVNPLPNEGKKIESENREDEKEYQEGPEVDDLDIDDFDDPTERLVSLMSSIKFMGYLQYTRVELYDELMSDNVSQDVVDKATEEYSKWMAKKRFNGFPAV